MFVIKRGIVRWGNSSLKAHSLRTIIWLKRESMRPSTVRSVTTTTRGRRLSRTAPNVVIRKKLFHSVEPTLTFPLPFSTARDSNLDVLPDVGPSPDRCRANRYDYIYARGYCLQSKFSLTDIFSSDNKNRMIAAFLTFYFGIFGIHKLYLG